MGRHQGLVAVGHLPLAIEQAAAWLAETGIPAALYAEKLETEATSTLGLNKPLDYAKPVVAAWNLSISSSGALPRVRAAPANPGLLLARPDFRDPAL